MLIIAIGLTVFGIVALIIGARDAWDRPVWGITGLITFVIGAIATFIVVIATICSIYGAYPEMQMFYELNADNYRVTVERQNEVATINLNIATEGEAFDGSDFAQSRETSNRYMEYRDAVNDYNLRLAQYQRQGGTFMFWPLPKPPEELKPIRLE